MVALDESARPDHAPALFVEVGRRKDLAHVPRTSACLGGKLVTKELRHAFLSESLSDQRKRLGFGVGVRETCGEDGYTRGVVVRLKDAGLVVTNGHERPEVAPVAE